MGDCMVPYHELLANICSFVSVGELGRGGGGGWTKQILKSRGKSINKLLQFAIFSVLRSLSSNRPIIPT